MSQEIKMVGKHMQRAPTSPITGEMKIKAMRCEVFTPGFAGLG